MTRPIEVVDTLVIADTCSVLDLIRSAHRHESRNSEVAAAIALRRRATDAPDELVIAVCDVTKSEFDNNVVSVVEEAGNGLSNVLKRVRHADAVAAHLGIAKLESGSAPWATSIINKSERLARDLLGDASVITSLTADEHNAIKRSRLRIPPARQASASTFDCLITECAVRVARSRTPGSTWLLTSNTKDFGAPGQRLHPLLYEEFSTVGLEFATSWTEVAGRLGPR